MAYIVDHMRTDCSLMAQEPKTQNANKKVANSVARGPAPRNPKSCIVRDGRVIVSTRQDRLQETTKEKPEQIRPNPLLKEKEGRSQTGSLGFALSLKT
eukprot:190770-Amphidinium_carterae.1